MSVTSSFGQDNYNCN